MRSNLGVLAWLRRVSEAAGSRQISIPADALLDALDDLEDAWMQAEADARTIELLGGAIATLTDPERPR